MSAHPPFAAALDDRYSQQPAWGTAPSDSLQYELFFGDRFLSLRAFKMPTCQFISGWMYDGGVVDLFSSYEPLTATDPAVPGLNVHNGQVSYAFGAGGGRIRIDPPGRQEISVEIAETLSTLWHFPPQDIVIHQPLLNVRLVQAGETWDGVGYAKRYTCGVENEHMYWRFINGPVASGGQTGWIWTAEAAFNLKKYDYFKRAHADGSIETAEQPGTWHRDRMAQGVLAGVPTQVEIEDLGRIERVVRAGGTNLKISQAFCSMTVRTGEMKSQGHALNEIACGTHA